MNTKSQIKKLARNLNVLQSITRAFEHTATQKMQINKKELEVLNTTLSEVKQTYVNAKISIDKKSSKANTVLTNPMRKPTKQKIVILITSEPAYYSRLLSYMATEFIKEASLPNIDAVIVGLPGKDEVEKRKKGEIKYRFFDFADDKPNWQVIADLSRIVMDYREINVIFAKFKSILNQDIIKEDLSQQLNVGAASEIKKYLIVPNPQSALSYLEQQIVTNQLLQKMYENGLTKGAIRVRILEIGEIAERLSESLAKFEKLKIKFTHEINNRKLANLYSAIDVWQTESIFTVYR